MFDASRGARVALAAADAAVDDVPWPEVAPAPWEVGQLPAAECTPSGWLALELDQCTADAHRLSDRELIDAMVGFERLAGWVGARQALLMAEFARRRPPETSSGIRSERPSRCGEFAADEVGLALSLSRTMAAARLTMAQVLVRDLPGTLSAWESGQIDVLKTRAITETAAVLPTSLHPDLEARVLPRAPKQTAAQLRAALSRAALALDPEGAAQRHQEARRDRRVVVTPEPDGMASLWVLLPAPAAVAAYEQLTRLARSIGAGDPRGMDARRADLVADLLTGQATGGVGAASGAGAGIMTVSGTENASGIGTDVGTGPGTKTGATPGSVTSTGSGSGAGRPLVQVTVPVTTLMLLDEHPGELAGYGPIPADLTREIAAEGTWRRLLTDPVSGVLLDRGHRTYTPPPGLADYVRTRDRYCRFPTCRQPATHADLDHTVPYHPRPGSVGAHNTGGTTSADNLAAYCRHHHRAKTLGAGWRTQQEPTGQITWTTPTGHHHTSRPHDYRPDPHPAAAHSAPDPLRARGPHPPPESPPPRPGTPPEDDPPPF